MTVDVRTPVNNYVGNDSATQFNFNFYIESSSQLEVYHTNRSGLQTKLTLGTDYSINAVGSETGSYITFPITGSTYTVLKGESSTGAGDAEKLSLVLSLPISQETEYGTSDKLNLNSLEYSLDYLTRIAQIMNRQLERAVKVSESSSINTDDLVNKINTVYKNISDINAIVADLTNINNVADDLTNINTVSTNITNVNAVGSDIANVNAVKNDLTNIDAVKNDLTNIDTVAGDISNINSVANDLTNIDAVKNDLTNIDAVNTNKTNIDTVATNITNVNAVGNDIANVNAVKNDLTNIDAVNANKTNIDTVAADLLLSYSNIKNALTNANTCVQKALEAYNSAVQAEYWAGQSAQAQIQSNWNETDETKKSFIQNKQIVTNAIAAKQDIIQYSTMPEASAAWLNKPVQYIGETTSLTYKWNTITYTSGLDADKPATGYYKATDTSLWYKDGVDITDLVGDYTGDLPTPDATQVGKYKYNTETTVLSNCVINTLPFTHAYIYEVEASTTTPVTYSWKQKDIQPHQNIKTINSESITGSGNVDLDNKYANKNNSLCFCFTSGKVNANGEPDIVNTDGSFNVSPVLKGLLADGTAFTRDNIPNLDISNLANGTYRLFLSSSGACVPLNITQVYRQKDIPVNNFTKIGFPKISKGIISNFSASDYLKIEQNFNPQNNNWEFRTKFKYKSNSTDNQLIIDCNDGTFLYRPFSCYISATGKMGYQVSSSNSVSGSIFNGDGTISLVDGTEYYVKFKFDGTSYKSYLSTTGEFNGEEILDINVNSNTTIYGGYPLYIGIFKPANSAVMLSTIDLKETYIKISDNYWWKPIIDNSIWLDMSIRPYTLKKYDGNAWQTFNYTPLPQKIVVANGAITSVVKCDIGFGENWQVNGEWYSLNEVMARYTSILSATDIDLSSYLPFDDYKYDLYMTVEEYTASTTAYDLNRLDITTDYTKVNIYTYSPMYGSEEFSLPIGDRKIRVQVPIFSGGLVQWVCTSYRRIGVN